MKRTKDAKQPDHAQHFNATYEFIDRFEIYLKSRGHTQYTIQSYLSCANHFLFWLKTRHLDENKINKSIVKRFLFKHIPECCCPEPVYKDIKTIRAALNQALSMEGYDRVRKIKVCTFPEIETEIDLFDTYLKKICGHAEATRWYHRRHIREFLLWLFVDKPVLVDKITSELICRFVSEKAATLQSSSVGVLVYSLRAYLKYLQLNGHITPSLQATIPRPPNWSGTSLPHALNRDEMMLFWSAFDCKTAVSKRDYAMARCLADLGLRCYEAATIQLDNIDWYNGVLHLPKTKSRREEALPIPDKMGHALANYLRCGRPKTNSRFVFVHHRAPKGHPVQHTTVRGAIRRAFTRADLAWTGTHILRSTFASRLLKGGASLKEIADLLRHRSIDTTKYYTKIDFTRLAQVALPWPRRSS